MKTKLTAPAFALACLAVPPLWAQTSAPAPVAPAPAGKTPTDQPLKPSVPPAAAAPAAPAPAAPAPAAPAPAAPAPTTPAPATPAPAAPAPAVPAPATSGVAPTPAVTPAPAITPEPAAVELVPAPSEPAPSSSVTADASVQAGANSGALGQATSGTESDVADAAELEPATRVDKVTLTSSDAPQAITPLIYTGSFFSRYELREGFAEHGLGANTHARLHREGDTFVYRARFGVETQPVKMGKQAMSVKFSPQAFGTHSTQGTPPTTGDSYDLRVHEAFIRLQGHGYRVDLGRFVLDYGEGNVIGASNWTENGRAFQGGRARLTSANSNDYYTDLFLTLVSEGSLATASIFAGDQYFYGAYTGLGPLGPGPNLDVYLLGRTWVGASNVIVNNAVVPPVTDTQEGATQLTVGARATQEFEAFDYRLEAGFQFGQSVPPVGEQPLDHVAFQLDGGAGVTPARGLRFGLGGTVTSGEEDPNDNVDRAWDELFPTGHAALGYTDVVLGRSNILAANLEASYKALDSLLLKTKGYLLARFVENLAGNRWVGTEVDTDVIYTIGKGASLRGTYSIFIPNNDYWQNGSVVENPQLSDPIHLFELQLGYDF